MQLEAHPSAFPNAEFEQLMARYQQADPGAVAVLVERLSPQLYRFFASQLGNRADAEDMLQDTWLRIHRVRHTYRAGDPVLPWVYTIARNACVDGARREQLRSAEPLAEEPLDKGTPWNDPERGAGSAELRPLLEAAIAALPKEQREVFLLREFAGIPFAEIARMTAAPEPTVKSRMRYALEALRAHLLRAGVESDAPGRTAS